MLTPADLRRTFLLYGSLLDGHRRAINGLNVYPVPDGDTGTNMAQTVASVNRHLEEVVSLHDTASAIARGALVGAAGNSGVILSQILRGFVADMGSVEHLDAVGVVVALERAAESAYKAVGTPVEGTILTVVRQASEAAREELAASGDLGSVLIAAHVGAVASLRSTPSLLPVLADAGVVDAGGAGLVLFLHALVEAVTGQVPSIPSEILDAVGTDGAILGVGGEGHGGGPRYEVMFFLEATDDDTVDIFKAEWSEMGDSIVVVGGDGLWNCHIHTDDVGGVIEAGIKAGRPTAIKMTDLHEQVGALEADVTTGGFTALPAALEAPIGVVSVVAGRGLVELFRNLNAQGVVHGGQSQNPSVETILEVVDAAPAEEIILLPNNKNIVPVAEQVDSLTTKAVVVVPTRSVAQGIASMLAYLPGVGGLEDLAEEMAAAATVAFGEVTQAVRAAHVDGWDVTVGDWMGLVDGGQIGVVDADRFAVLRGLVAVILPDPAELITVYTGEGSSPSDVKALEAWVGETHPQVAVSVVAGGQPLYPYIVSVE